MLRVDAAPRFYTYRMEFRDPHGRPRHTRGRHRRAHAPRTRRHERAPARADRGQGEVRPARAAARDARERRPDLGPQPRARPHAGARARDTCSRPAPTPTACSHELGAIDDPARIAKIRTMIGEQPIVLADGHHRFETACNYRNELRAAGEEVGGAGAIMMLVVELDDDELDIEPIHRLLDLPPDVDLRARLGDAFDIIAVGPYSPDNIDAPAGADGGRARPRPRRPRRPRGRGPPRRAPRRARSPTRIPPSRRPTPPSSRRS